MSDPLLEALRILPRLFALTAKGLSPISIRDQMVRAQMLVTRALEQGEITRADKVLVVGAGAAGAVAAMTSASCGLETVIIDRKSQPFLRQAGCATRWIDPMQYDWPADHWSPGKRYPLYSLVPLPWDADLSFRIAARWRRAFFRALSSRLRFYPRTRVTAIVPVGGPPPSELEVHFQSPNLATSSFQLVIWAAGFGEEICSIRDERHGTGTVQHTGPAFWSSDSLEKRGCGSSVSNPKVAILGAGDGGVQDLLRALTKRRSAREVVDSLRIDPAIMNELHNAEERAHRHWIWAGTNGRHDHALYDRLDIYHRAAAAEALTSAVLRDDLRTLLELDTESLEDVRLFHRCSHLMCLYGLNRFLAYLLDQFFREELGKNLLVPNRTVVGVDTTLVPHVLDTVDHPICYDRVDTTLPSKRDTAHVIIVRYGLDVSSAALTLPTGVNMQRRRHSIPVVPVP
ncbi:MAG: FAD-binding protein [Verrucomicrobia bacterium]|nr:FAD-binding protein [Verrucomicrobiota bacterium]MBV8641132.1 FAD-binding protein [Verrucomicrobiota bacterium]